MSRFGAVANVIAQMAVGLVLVALFLVFLYAAFALGSVLVWGTFSWIINDAPTWAVIVAALVVVVVIMLEIIAVKRRRRKLAIALDAKFLGSDIDRLHHRNFRRRAAFVAVARWAAFFAVIALLILGNLPTVLMAFSRWLKALLPWLP